MRNFTASSLQSRLLIAFILLMFAGSLRFYKLGKWPFADDEIYTLEEEQSLFAGGEVPRDSQIYRLPRAVPLSHLLQHVSIEIFGRDEFGSRVVMAVLGSLSVGLVFLTLDVLNGRATATATALLVALWPDHVFYSQQTRFYMIAAFFACLCVLVGAFAARRTTPLLSILLGCSVFAAVLCHTLMGILLPITVAGVMLGAHAERRPIPKNVILVFVVTLIGLIIFFAFYLKALLIGWNAGATWGYGILHSCLASVYMVGWPVALLAAVGFFMLLQDRNTQNWYWMTTALGWGLTTVVFPLLVAHHPAYVFPLSISVVILAGCAIGRVYEGLQSQSAYIGAAWIGLACLGNLPGLASHYMDGSRPDIRTAANYVEKHWQPGDRVTAFWIDVFSHYAEDSRPAVSLPDSGDVDVLNKLADGKSRLWVVVQSTRSGLPEKVRRWLGAHCSYELKVRRTRFDYAEYCVEVFLYTPVSDKVHPGSLD